jgi:AraC-like DNA-binding protein
MISPLQIRMTDNAPDRFYFNTDEFSERDRFPVFCEQIVRRYGALDIAQRGEELFRGVIELQRAGPVDVSSRFSTPADYVRSPKLVGDGNDSIFVVLCRSGCLQTCSDHELNLATGDAAVCDLGYTGSVRLIANSHFSTIRIPRSIFLKSLPRVGRPNDVRMDRDDMALRLLFGYIDGTLHVPLAAGSRATELYGEHIVDLVALATGANGEAREIAEQRGVRAARLAAILRMISQQFDNPGLSAATIAIQLGVTPRYVHLLLEATGCSFAEHLLDRRLEQAALLLRDPRRQDRKITDIARQTGFVDLSHFNRAFRRHFGETPSGVRGTAFRNFQKD